MRIRVINSVLIMNRGGQETLLMNVLKNIDKSKFQYDFLCSLHRKGDYDDEIKSLGSKVYLLPYNSLSGKRIIGYFGDVYKYYSFFKNNKDIDILHIHSYHSFSIFIQVLGAKLGGCKRIVVHSHNSNAPHPRLHLVFRRFLSLFKIKKLACSELAASWMYGNSIDGVEVIKNGIILNNFEFNEEWRINKRKELGISEETLLVGHVGRLDYQKNHSFLLDIFSEVIKLAPSAMLVLVGKGPLENEIRAKIKALNLNDKVLLLGTRSDVNQLYSCFDVFLFPSLFEGLSVVLVEAQATGLQCVISDTNSKEVGLTKCVTFLSLNKSPYEWAQVVVKQATKQHEDTHQEMRKSGYDIVTSTRKLESIYIDIICNK